MALTFILYLDISICTGCSKSNIVFSRIDIKKIILIHYSSTSFITHNMYLNHFILRFWLLFWSIYHNSNFIQIFVVITNFVLILLRFFTADTYILVNFFIFPSFFFDNSVLMNKWSNFFVVSICSRISFLYVFLHPLISLSHNLLVFCGLHKFELVVYFAL